MQIKTVGDLARKLDKLPTELPLKHYTGHLPVSSVKDCRIVFSDVVEGSTEEEMDSKALYVCIY